MHKLTKQVLTGVVALGLLAPVVTQAISNSPQTTVQAKSRWHKGAPRVIQSNYYWYSNRRYNHSHRHNNPYNINVIWFQHAQVEMADKQYMRKAKRYNGTYTHNPKTHWIWSTGWGSWWNPHYKYVGHHTYRINTGDNELHYTVKVHNHKHVSVWLDGHYMGYFHRGKHIPRY